MKKLIFSFFLISMLLFSMSTFAVETAVPVGAVPITATSAKPVDVKILPPSNNSGCPMMQDGTGMINNPGSMMQGGQGMMNGNCQMMQGGTGMMKPGFNSGRPMMKFRNNQKMNQCMNGRPKIFMWIGMGIKFLACLLFWILLIVLLVMLIKWALKPHHMMHCWKNNSALDILQERFAKGEITTEQYEEMKTKIS